MNAVQFCSAGLIRAVILIGLIACHSRPDLKLEQTVMCCDGLGACLPQAFLTPRTASMLGQATCDDGLVCVPDELRSSAAPTSCTTASFGAEGRCVPACVPMVSALGDRVAIDGCAPHQRCVPCYDPLTGAFTAACGSNDDAPKELPRVFADCCEHLGRCVPWALVPESARSVLGRDSCESAAELCAPESLLNDPQSVPLTCTVSAFGAEGRCVPACLPGLDPARAQLKQDNCGAGELCAPCFDPLTGNATGSCAVGGDPGPVTQPTVFGSCCSGEGRCLPQTSVPTEQAALLGRDTCESEASLCLPEIFLTQRDFVPSACRSSPWDSEGRCLSECLPAVAARADVLTRDSCAEGQRCVPCYDPLTAAPSGACTVNGDAPAEPPVLATHCCDDLGRCIHESLIPANLVSQFDSNGCDDISRRCVAPASFFESMGGSVPSCRDQRTGAEGRCLPECLAAVGKRASLLSAEGCGSHQLCVPCFDPLTGESTSACEQPGDRGPTEPKVVFAGCCDDAGVSLGVCVPPSVLPPGSPDLPAQSCVSNNVCIPRALAADPKAVLTQCSDALTGAGLCVATCFLGDSVAGSFLSRASCQENERCAPCSQLGTGLTGC